MNTEEVIYKPAKHPGKREEKSWIMAFGPQTKTLPKGSRLNRKNKPTEVDMVMEKDVAVTLRDGTTIYVDIYRPAGLEDIPAIISWSPYGKGDIAGPRNIGRWAFGVKNSELSGFQKWEAIDPALWCANGYAVCQPDARGAFYSEGDIIMFGKQEGRDAADLVEWLAARPWCNGKVGMAGNSWLAIAQWFCAAEQPEHLAAIAPWEGLSDMYRDAMYAGGIPEFGFTTMVGGNLIGSAGIEDMDANGAAHPLFDEYWATKELDYGKVQVPTYAVSSYTNTVHTNGTFRAFENIASKDKWLRIHASMEWPDFYESENQADLMRFFEHYLKGEENGWEKTPRVRYSLLDMHGGAKTGIETADFPPKGTPAFVRYLDAASRGLCEDMPASDAEVAYETDGKSGMAEFTMRFDESVELVGYPVLTLWVEARGNDDMDLFVMLQKLDANGRALSVVNPPKAIPPLKIVSKKRANIVRYKGSPGRLRVSMRALDEDASRGKQPRHTFDRMEKLAPGEIVEAVIPLAPIGMTFEAGEQLRITVSEQNLNGPVVPLYSGVLDTVNSGEHVIHTGPNLPSRIEIGG